MDIELKNKFDIFEGTYKEMKNSFFFDGKRINLIKALESISNNRDFDADKIKEIRKYLFKLKFDLFTMRYGRFISTFICDCENYGEVYKTSRNIYENFTAVGFKKNKRTLALSLLLSRNFKGDKLSDNVEKIVHIKKYLKLKGEEYFILPALQSKTYEEIESEFHNTKSAIMGVKSYTENMAELLSLAIMIGNEDINTKVENAFSLVCHIKGEIGSIPEKSLVFIGLASLIIENAEEFASELNFLYSLFNKNNIKSLNKNRNILFALSILIVRYIEEAKGGVTHLRISNDALKIIEDYVICLMYFN